MWKLILCILGIAQVATSKSLVFSPQDVSVKLDHNVTFQVWYNGIGKDQSFQLWAESNGYVQYTCDHVVPKGEKLTVTVKGIKPGHVVLVGNSSVEDLNTVDAFVRVTIGKSSTYIVVSEVVGWLYFAAWSISFYPQMYENWKRKSVVGLNFDFLALNFLGFFLYSLFNIGLYSLEPIKRNYHEKYPHSVIPVQVNDIVFSVHAFLAVAATFVQCYFYERENQKVSKFAKALFVMYAIFLGISLVLASTEVIDALEFLYYCSYVKLSITLIKYIPQAYMNYKRKSTIGWSIGNIFLDFTGGTLSMLQMIINSYNYDDWESIFGDVTKFGLGLFSVLFDIFFIVQHYVLYRYSEPL